MFSKLNLQYKKSINHKKNNILIQEQIKQKTKQMDDKSINNALIIKVDNNKIKNITETIKKENILTLPIDNSISLKITDGSNINTDMINNLTTPDIDIDLSIIDKDNTIQHKITDGSNINTKMIEKLTIPDIDIDLSIIDKDNNFQHKITYCANISTKMIENLVTPDVDINIIDNNLQHKLTDVPNINTKMIENLIIPDIDISKTDNNLQHKLTDGANINTKMIDTINITPINSNELFEVPFNVDLIRRKGIKIFNNVYQSKYNNNKSNSTGLGDFIRGSYFILEFCDKYEFQPKIIFNSCISNFLKIKTHNIELIQNILNNINFFANNNLRSHNVQNDFIFDPIKDTEHIMSDFVDYTINSPTYYGNVFTFCNSFPNYDIPNKNKEYMKKILEPIDEMKFFVHKTLNELELQYKKYSVIHIRSGDSYLKNENNEVNTSYLYKLIKTIKNDIQKNTDTNPNIEKKYLLVADNNIIKFFLKSQFPYLKFIVKDITHFGEGVLLEEEKVKNTLLDFYLLSFSVEIMGYSCYQHGSGFSYWCAKTYNIPYFCKYINQ